jgi:hypothetical protein
MALGATLWGDRRLLGVEKALAKTAVEAARDQLKRFDSEGNEGKQRMLRALVARVRGDLTALDCLPARARALLARHVPREHGRRLIADVREARPDFVASAALIQTLLHQARILPRESSRNAAKNSEG